MILKNIVSSVISGQKGVVSTTANGGQSRVIINISYNGNATAQHIETSI